MAKALGELADVSIDDCKHLLIEHANRVLEDLEDGVEESGKIHYSGNDEYSDSVQISYLSLGEYVREFSRVLRPEERRLIAEQCDKFRDRLENQLEKVKGQLADFFGRRTRKETIKKAIKELEETSSALRNTQ